MKNLCIPLRLTAGNIIICTFVAACLYAVCYAFSFMPTEHQLELSEEKDTSGQWGTAGNQNYENHETVIFCMMNLPPRPLLLTASTCRSHARGVTYILGSSRMFLAIMLTFEACTPTITVGYREGTSRLTENIIQVAASLGLSSFLLLNVMLAMISGELTSYSRYSPYLELKYCGLCLLSVCMYIICDLHNIE